VRGCGMRSGVGAVLLSIAMAGTTAAQQAPVAAGDWDRICDAEGCRIAQSLLAAGGTVPVMTVRVWRTPRPLLLISVPLGIFLKPGLSLQIDATRAEMHVFEICDENGCHAGVPLDDALLAGLRRGRNAVIGFEDSQRRPVRLPLSLTGFTAAFAGLPD
jgi:invasion protein IalB